MEKVKLMTRIGNLGMVRMVSAEVQLQDCSFQSQIFVHQVIGAGLFTAYL